ncbi:hypothetical protein EV182_006243, partial [Spiromyces aspiralis]
MTILVQALSSAFSAFHQDRLDESVDILDTFRRQGDMLRSQGATSDLTDDGVAPDAISTYAPPLDDRMLDMAASVAAEVRSLMVRQKELERELAAYRFSRNNTSWLGTLRRSASRFVSGGNGRDEAPESPRSATSWLLGSINPFSKSTGVPAIEGEEFETPNTDHDDITPLQGSPVPDDDAARSRYRSLTLPRSFSTRTRTSPRPPAAGPAEDVCFECIRQCELVVDAIARGDFTSRVRCSRCHCARYGPRSGEAGPSASPFASPAATAVYPDAGAKQGAAAVAALAPLFTEQLYNSGAWHYTNNNPMKTPHISDARTHTERLANTVNTMASML